MRRVRLGIKGKQIAGVTAIVGVAVLALSGLYVTRLAGVVLHESHARGELLSNAILHRAREVVTGAPDPYAALQDDPGLRAILEASLYGESVTGASILDTAGIVIASSDPTRIGLRLEDRPDLAALGGESALEQLRVIYSPEGQTLELRQPMMLGDEAFGSIRIGVSTLLMRQEVNTALRPALLTAAVALAVAVLVAGLLAQLLLRPIHVLRGGLTRLGKGEFGVTLDLPPGDEFGELGSFFNAVSRQLSADRAAQADQKTEQVVAYSRKLVALWRLTAGIAHEVKNPLNAMMIHLELLRTKIRSGVLEAAPQPVAASSAALGLSAPDQPMTNPALEVALEHVHVIESEIRRLDEVVQGFLKFTRPEDLRLQAVSVPMLFEEILPVIEPEAQTNRVKVVVDAPASVPEVHGDAAMLRQVLLNLAINACQAMPDGGTLRLVAAPGPRRMVEVRVEDTGVGIPSENLGKIFDLYYTTKDHGTGIGLSMVYRIVQMHDGELEAQSTPGRGTTFRILLPRVNEA
ncbi:MAG: HAMP domain-containing protein [Acidobacteria bacterium]|nr:HAMP domain-containing protein [Acidobacteriota bacterium]